VVVTRGSPDDPLRYGVVEDQPITGAPPSDDYAAGGSVYRDPASGRWLLFYHAEQWPAGRADRYYSTIGLATSTDQGRSWQNLGEIIRPNRPYDPAASEPVEVGGGPYVTVDGYFYVYFRDDLGPGTSQLSVARAPIDAVLAASETGHVVAWSDYDAGRWDQPAIGGLASPLEAGNPATRWFDVAWDATLARFVLVVAADDANGVQLYLAESPDGLRWSDRRPITSGSAESFYPTLVGLGPDPSVLGPTFDLYSVVTPAGQPRWSDTVLIRRTVSLSTTC
jgi:hypothetical protein